MASNMSAVGANGAEAAVTRARAFERGNDFARAIDAYLSASPADTKNLDALQQCWEQVGCLLVLLLPVQHVTRSICWHSDCCMQILGNFSRVHYGQRKLPASWHRHECSYSLQAANVAMQHQRHRMHEVVAAVAQRLVGIGRVAAAAELQEGINDVQGRSPPCQDAASVVCCHLVHSSIK